MRLSVAYDVLPRICYTETAFVKISSQTVQNIQYCTTTKYMNLNMK